MVIGIYLKKQEVARKKREQQRLEKYLGGLENMSHFRVLLLLSVNLKKFMQFVNVVNLEFQQLHF